MNIYILVYILHRCVLEIYISLVITINIYKYIYTKHIYLSLNLTFYVL